MSRLTDEHPKPQPRNAYMRCTGCGYNYLGQSKCPYCGDHTGKSMNDGEDVTRKTFDEPDLKKG